MTAPAEDAPDFDVVLPWSEDRDGLWEAVRRLAAMHGWGGDDE